MKVVQGSLFFVFFMLSSYSFAEESWYQVEIVLFERLNPTFDGELWQADEYAPRANLIELIPEDEIDDPQVPFSLLPVAKNRLAGTNQAFKLSSAYRPLIHYSWQQPALERRDSRFVHVQKLDESMQQTNENLTTEAQEIFEEPAFIEDIIQPNKIIDGSIRIRSGFYLHIDVDLTYFASIPELYRIKSEVDDSIVIDNVAAIDLDIIPVNLKSSRKVKLNEIHYFDHPMFGLVIQVSRL
ncbi:MAG: CsiV family protein [Pseudomonadota bacterium]